MSHTPPKSGQAKDATEFSCQVCDRPDSMSMVSCDICRLWFHYECVGVTNEIEDINVPWICNICSNKKILSNKSHRTSSKVSSRRRRQANRELQLLEEERALEEKRWDAQKKADELFIERKRQLLQQQESSTSDELDVESNTEQTRISTSRSYRRTKEWVESPKNMDQNKDEALTYVVEDEVPNYQLNGPTNNVQNKHCLNAETRQNIDNHSYTISEITTDSHAVTSKEDSGHQVGIGNKPLAFSYQVPSQPTFTYQANRFVIPAKIQTSNVTTGKLFQVNTCNVTTAINQPIVTSYLTNEKTARKPVNLNGNLYAASTFANIPLISEHNHQALQHNTSMSRHQVHNKASFHENQPLPKHNNKYMSSYCPTNLPYAAYHDENKETALPPAYAMEVQSHLSRSHLAARQALPKELLSFNGSPEEWPLFISSYERSTNMCGFSQEENLVRLQRCLKGQALEAVRSRLFLPSRVPNVIATLKQLYGRPELIINKLLQKVRNQPNPKVEKLETIITYALAVQNLCSTMEACDLTDHLRNPMLLQELLNKLPAQIKLSWAIYQQTLPSVTLSTFDQWLSDLAAAANTVSMPELYQSKEKYVHAHAGAVANEDQTRKGTTENVNEICCICAGSHQITNCTKFAGLKHSARWSAVKENKLCRRCLARHISNRCKSQRICGKNDCQYKHHPLLHNDSTTLKKNSVHNVTTVESNCNTHQKIDQSVLFRIIPVILHGPSKSIKTFAFLDEGSSITLLENQIANDLELVGSTESLCLKWTSDTVRVERDSKRVGLEISGDYEDSRHYKMSNVRTVNKLSLPVQSLDKKTFEKKYSHLRKLPILDYSKAVPRILIGIDNGKLGLPLDVKEGSWKEPIATKTRLGWTIHGCYHHKIKPNNTPIIYDSFHACECKPDEELHQLVKDYFAIDSANVKSPLLKIESDSEIRARQIMEKTTVRKNDRFETGLLWKYDKFILPDSLPMAKRRLTCLEKKMALDKSLSLSLKTQMKDYVSKGYARELSLEEIKTKNPRTWYLPLFAVTNPNKPGKIRMVWDAAAKVDGVSLNSMLLKGPDQLALLPAVLYGLREYKIAICGDIREMFHQVRIRPDDQHSQRFLWRENKLQEPKVYAMQVMTFGATCSPSSAQYVKNKNALEFADQYPRAATAITQRHYVDDLLDSLDNEQEAIQLAKDVRYVHSKAGFEIRNWVSNSKAFLAALGESKSLDQKELNMCTDNATSKVLGMWWCTSSDTFTYKMNSTKLDDAILKCLRKPTKREVLRTLMSIFDPLGFLAFFMVYAKILMQEIWRSSIDWDDILTDKQYEMWNLWATLLPMVEKVRIPRCYSLSIPSEKRKSIQVHVFVDASENAYAAVGYLRIANTDGIQVALVGARTKVSPLKPMSIPRLELQAATLGARLVKSITQNHSFKINKCVLWSDSKTVLSWLRSNERRYNQFVAFRIAEILENTEVKAWRWVPTKLNVADEATKWQKIPDFERENRWFSGPEFLQNDEDNWPCDITSEIAETKEELRASLIHVTVVNIPCTVNSKRFSSWQRLLRAQMRLIRCAQIFKAKATHQDIPVGSFSSSDFNQAETQLLRRAQFDCFADEITVLLHEKNNADNKKSKQKIQKSSSIYTWSPYLDNDGLLRVRGRIDNASGIEFTTKRPIILPSDNVITRLVINNFHKKFHHQNTETVVNEIRQKFAIPKVRRVLKTVKSKCQQCKNERANPRAPEMAHLPKARLATFTRPFSFVGVDYFGPLSVTVNRHTEKRWGVLFTCLTIRAVHLEIANSLSTDSCIMCVRNFMARRGTPKIFYSDNGTNFHGADKELQRAFKEISTELIEASFTNGDMKWHFNPPASPHMGGSWERLVGSVKKILNKIMPQRNPTDEILRSLLIEVESIINTRPLTFVSIDIDDDTALTPNHFLLGSSSGMKPPGKFCNTDLILKRNWRKTQQLLNIFWKKWIADYLPTLTRRTKWFHPVKPIEVGDVVIVVDENLPRNCWPMGRVIETKPGKDGAVRRVTVQTKNNIYERPAVKIAVLDIKADSE